MSTLPKSVDVSVSSDAIVSGVIPSTLPSTSATASASSATGVSNDDSAHTAGRKRNRVVMGQPQYEEARSLEVSELREKGFELSPVDSYDVASVNIVDRACAASHLVKMICMDPLKKAAFYASRPSVHSLASNVMKDRMVLFSCRCSRIHYSVRELALNHIALRHSSQTYQSEETAEKAEQTESGRPSRRIAATRTSDNASSPALTTTTAAPAPPSIANPSTTPLKSRQTRSSAAATHEAAESDGDHDMDVSDSESISKERDAGSDRRGRPPRRSSTNQHQQTATATAAAAASSSSSHSFPLNLSDLTSHDYASVGQLVDSDRSSLRTMLPVASRILIEYIDRFERINEDKEERKSGAHNRPYFLCKQCPKFPPSLRLRDICRHVLDQHSQPPFSCVQNGCHTKVETVEALEHHVAESHKEFAFSVPRPASHSQSQSQSQSQSPSLHPHTKRPNVEAQELLNLARESPTPYGKRKRQQEYDTSSNEYMNEDEHEPHLDLDDSMADDHHDHDTSAHRKSSAADAGHNEDDSAAMLLSPSSLSQSGAPTPSPESALKPLLAAIHPVSQSQSTNNNSSSSSHFAHNKRPRTTGPSPSANIQTIDADVDVDVDADDAEADALAAAEAAAATAASAAAARESLLNNRIKQLMADNDANHAAHEQHQKSIEEGFRRRYEALNKENKQLEEKVRLAEHEAFIAKTQMAAMAVNLNAANAAVTAAAATHNSNNSNARSSAANAASSAALESSRRELETVRRDLEQWKNAFGFETPILAQRHLEAEAKFRMAEKRDLVIDECCRYLMSMKANAQPTSSQQTTQQQQQQQQQQPAQPTPTTTLLVPTQMGAIPTMSVSPPIPIPIPMPPNAVPNMTVAPPQAPNGIAMNSADLQSLTATAFAAASAGNPLLLQHLWPLISSGGAPNGANQLIAFAPHLLGAQGAPSTVTMPVPISVPVSAPMPSPAASVPHSVSNNTNHNNHGHGRSTSRSGYTSSGSSARGPKRRERDSSAGSASRRLTDHRPVPMFTDALMNEAMTAGIANATAAVAAAESAASGGSIPSPQQLLMIDNANCMMIAAAVAAGMSINAPTAAASTVSPAAAAPALALATAPAPSPSSASTPHTPVTIASPRVQSRNTNNGSQTPVPITTPVVAPTPTPPSMTLTANVHSNVIGNSNSTSNLNAPSDFASLTGPMTASVAAGNTQHSMDVLPLLESSASLLQKESSSSHLTSTATAASDVTHPTPIAASDFTSASVVATSVSATTDSDRYLDPNVFGTSDMPPLDPLVSTQHNIIGMM